ncbi:hypothetical protein HK101_005620 [Irineochytrium annulatum]|nr:hypothetical protein HK101_005620 [Irineochytrium annulatum]
MPGAASSVTSKSLSSYTPMKPHATPRRTKMLPPVNAASSAIASSPWELGANGGMMSMADNGNNGRDSPPLATGEASGAGVAGERTEQPAKKGKKDKDFAEEEKGKQEEILDPEDSYQPFALSNKSSFNPGTLSVKQRKTMDMLTRAKFGAYEKPEPTIATQIDQSRARAKRWSKEEHHRLREQIFEIRRCGRRRRGLLDEEEEREAQEAARKANERMRGKLKSIVMSRDNELQFLVEGQRNAIDAIRLKEFLVIRPPNVNMGKEYSDKDRLRVEELLAG